MVAKLFQVPENLVPIVGMDSVFPVRRIFCIGRNYAAHAVEMGLSGQREPPFYFTKFVDDLVVGGGSIPYPSGTKDYQYETELVVAIGRAGANVTVAKALDLAYGYAVGLDMTRRDLQLDARAKGLPWDVGKNFAFSAPIGPISPAADIGHLSTGAIRLTVNGALKQSSDVSKLLWNVPELIAFLSRLDRLQPGDLIYTGTPEGVAPVTTGDVLHAHIEGLQPLSISIGASEPEFQ